jgi:hypothetical protein
MFWYLLTGLALFVCAYLVFRRRQQILDTPTALATSAAVGRAELSGVARGEPASTSPVTGAACAYWEAELWEYQTVLRKSRWAMVAKETADVDRLWLEDRSGRIPIFLYGVHWELDDEDEFSKHRPLPKGGQAFVERHGHSWNPARYKVKERRVGEGKPLYVLGTLSESSAVIQALTSDSSWMAFGKKMLKRSESLQHPRFQPTALGDSRRVGLSRAVIDPVGVLQASLAPTDVVVWCATEGLLIGTGDQSRVARRLMRSTLYCLAGGAVMVVLAIVL